MSTILPTSLLAQPFALSTTALDELQALTPLAALDVTAVTALASESVTPIASTDVAFSPVAQFQSALAQSHQLLYELQTPEIGSGAPAAGTGQLSSAEQLNTLTDAAQNLVAAYNLLQADGTTATLSAPTAVATPAPLLDQLQHSVSQPYPAADASKAAGPATLADIGNTLQEEPAIDTGACLTLDAQALQTAYAANPQGTVALLNQTTDTFEQLGDQYAEQRSVEAAVPPLLVAVQAGASGSAGSNSAGVVPAAGVSQDTLADLALLDAFAGSATQAQSASSASNEAAALAQLDQLDQLQQQHQLDQARDAYATQLAALPPQAGAARTPGAPARQQAAGRQRHATAGRRGDPAAHRRTAAGKRRQRRADACVERQRSRAGRAAANRSPRRRGGPDPDAERRPHARSQRGQSGGGRRTGGRGRRRRCASRRRRDGHAGRDRRRTRADGARQRRRQRRSAGRQSGAGGGDRRLPSRRRDGAGAEPPGAADAAAGAGTESRAGRPGRQRQRRAAELTVERLPRGPCAKPN